MKLNSKDIQELDRIKRLNLINSLTGIKPANLIGTVSEEGVSNLAVFSSVIHLGSNPPLFGLISRPTGEVRRDTYTNIKNTGVFTVNHVPETMIENAHYTAAKFDEAESEFLPCGFSEHYIEGFAAPFVKESLVQIGLKFVDEIPIPLNGTVMLIGEIQYIMLPDSVLSEEYYIDLEMTATAGISGLNSYYCLNRLAVYPYPRYEELPTFELQEEV